ncbi:MAG: L-threonylcarbamoyladenylate synthase [Hornefia butyriciproducens]|uniref:L-threonylcarbamoyladenylate synthase n=1 Tax=Hornefia butyriciproducens TaxID=2652293 RepID=UPI0029FDD0E4|nr:L-threonylcarbamoyladenylate synthase [Hornefia butyriciproducens]MDD7020628.1 L-threonylcarbamoyladenylate synthase [Hornefia butyriciproducens]MDY2991336.1 L-threonylcarbamoyladenylate synthase [Hornefia butyriciproducens]
MKTRLLKDTEEDIRIAAKIIEQGGLVAFPTETVYGLGANAMDADAVRKIYEAKGRPADNPTIVHIAEREELGQVTFLVTEDMKTLMDRFWPGPMTMIVPRGEYIPYVTTGNLETVGVRMPENEVARELIRRSGCPIAAPSANLSGKPSPTTAQHVIDDLDGRIDAVIQSGPCRIGIESTVIDMTGKIPMILRPGYITKKDFEEALGQEILLDPTLNRKPREGEDFHPKAPGMKYRHYAPRAEMIIFKGDRIRVEAAIDQERAEREALGQKVFVIDFDEDRETVAAHEIFAMLRQADREGADVILAAALPQRGVGFSVMNRMLKSAGFNVREV